MFWWTMRQRRVLRPVQEQGSLCQFWTVRERADYVWRRGGEQRELENGVEAMRRHTELVSFTEPHLLGQEIQTLVPTLILYVGTVAVRLRRATDALPQRLRQQRHCRLCRIGCEFLSRSLNEVIDGPLPVIEGSVVLGDLTFAVVRVPGADFDGYDEVESGEVELESVRLHEKSVSFCSTLGGTWDRR